jgi:hypothetical protein
LEKERKDFQKRKKEKNAKKRERCISKYETKIRKKIGLKEKEEKGRKMEV